MPGSPTLTAARVRRLRSAAQLLHRPRRMIPADVVHHLVGVQAQVLSASALALRSRTHGLTEAAVTRARTQERAVVLAWAMRGTLHLVTADDHGRLVPLLTAPYVERSLRRLEEEGVTGDQPRRATRAIERMLERDGPLTRPEIAERLSRRAIRTEGQAIAHLMWLAAAKATVCYGPDRDGKRTFVLARDWIGAPTAVDRDLIVADLAVRYLRSHAPAGPEDLAAWSGLRMRDATGAWAAIADRIVQIDLPRGPKWVFRSGIGETPPDLVRLLPRFDEYLLGWKGRGFAVALRHEPRINAGGGWIHAVVVHDGRVIATWRMDPSRDGHTIAIDAFSRLSSAARRGASADVRDMARFLGSKVELEAVERGAPAP